MTRPIIKLVDASTGEEVEREMNDTEFTKYQETIAEWQAKTQEAEAKAAQRQALLDKLGITEDEARLLLGGN